jgi:hypothetical protein
MVLPLLRSPHATTVPTGQTTTKKQTCYVPWPYLHVFLVIEAKPAQEVLLLQVVQCALCQTANAIAIAIAIAIDTAIVTTIAIIVAEHIIGIANVAG